MPKVAAKASYDDALLFGAVKEVAQLVDPTDLTRVTQRPFDRARQRSERFSDCPQARRITEQLGLPWKKVLSLAAMNPRARATAFGQSRTEAANEWLTKEHVDSVLQLVARRLSVDTMTPAQYWGEAEAMLWADRARWMHGRQLRLPNPNQVEAVAGTWDRALAHAGLRARRGLVGYVRNGSVPTVIEILDRCYVHHGAQPSVRESEVFARANGIPYSRRERGRSWASCVEEWKADRRARGLEVPDGPPPKGQHPDYSQDVGAALPGERRGRKGGTTSMSAWSGRRATSRSSSRAAGQVSAGTTLGPGGRRALPGARSSAVTAGGTRSRTRRGSGCGAKGQQARARRACTLTGANPIPANLRKTMAENSRIEWTSASWNPVTGCDQISPGCAHCYAKTFAERFRGVPGHPYEQGFDLRLWPDRLELPLRWRKPKLIFVNSMSDLFHEAIPVEYIERIFDVMQRADHHVFQVLTKRHERLAELAPALPWPENVWAGVSIENRRFVHRAECLREVPAAVRFISAEPLLGHLDGLDLAGVDWLIAGGESGPRHRRIDPDWVRDLRDRCGDEEVAFFFKQWGGRSPKALGRELDGRTWDEMPTTRARELLAAI